MDSATRELLTRLTGSDTAAARDVLAERHCKTEAAAHRAILAEWQSFLDRAGLVERMTPKESPQ